MRSEGLLRYSAKSRSDACRTQSGTHATTYHPVCLVLKAFELRAFYKNIKKAIFVKLPRSKVMA